jgi:type IV pilus assembly protein PilO
MAAAKKNRLAKLNPAARAGVVLLMLLLPAVGYYVIFHSEIQSEINAEENRHQVLQGQLKDALVAEHAYQKDLEELRERERTKRELMKVLPVSTEYPAFLSSVQSVANLVGVELQAWTPLEEVPEEFYARVPMKLSLEGRFHQLAKFFYNVGQLERIINMENIALASPEETNGEIHLKAEVLATAFHAVEEEAEAAAAGSRNRRDRTP